MSGGHPLAWTGVERRPRENVLEIEEQDREILQKRL